MDKKISNLMSRCIGLGTAKLVIACLDAEQASTEDIGNTAMDPALQARIRAAQSSGRGKPNRKSSLRSLRSANPPKRHAFRPPMATAWAGRQPPAGYGYVRLQDIKDGAGGDFIYMVGRYDVTLESYLNFPASIR